MLLLLKLFPLNISFLFEFVNVDYIFDTITVVDLQAEEAANFSDLDCVHL